MIYGKVNYEMAFMLVVEGAWSIEEFREWFFAKENEAHQMGMESYQNMQEFYEKELG